MPISSYAELQTAVKNWLHREGIRGFDDVADIVPDLILLGEKRIFREVRHRTMEATLASTIVGTIIPSLPSGYVALRHAYVDVVPVQYLLRKEPEFIYQQYPDRTSSAIPEYIAREGTTFIFAPVPDSTYTIRGIYYQRLTSIVTGTANALFQEFPDLYLFAALAETRRFIEDDLSILGVWEQSFERVKQEVNSEEWREHRSGSSFVSTFA